MVRPMSDCKLETQTQKLSVRQPQSAQCPSKLTTRPQSNGSDGGPKKVSGVVFVV
jgi:hypothetical protein